MGLSAFNIHVPKIRPTTLLLCFVAGISRLILLIIVFLIPSCFKISSSQSSHGELNHTFQSEDDQISPSLVSNPLHFIVETIKERLPVSEFSARESDTNCVVCLRDIVECDKVRRLVNCRHVFHKECIDAWIDKCKKTCPVCRSDLLPGQVPDGSESGEDPWRD